MDEPEGGDRDETVDEGVDEIDQVVAYTSDLGEIGDEMVEDVDKLLYAEEPEDDIGLDVETVSLSDEDLGVNGLDILYDESSGADLDPGLLEEDLSADDLYSEEELDKAAEELSGYDGLGSGIPFVGTFLDKFFGSEVDPEDVTLDQLEGNEDLMNEGHESYLEAMEVYSSIEERVGSSENALMFGSNQEAGRELVQENEGLNEYFPEDTGYLQFGVTEEGDIVETPYEGETGEDSGMSELDPDVFARMAAQYGGVDELYGRLEEERPEIYEEAEEIREEVEGRYEDIAEDYEEPQTPESPGSEAE